MKPSLSRSLFTNQIFPIAIATLCVASLTPGDYAFAQSPQAQSAVQRTTTTESDVPKIPNDQLDSLVAPIALFPDPLLAQTLAASTYPLEIIQLQQWMEKNPGLKDKALADAVAKQPWDPSVQALAVIPDVVQRLAGNVQWTTELGNAFLAQQTDVMDAVQRMRGKAETKGALKTSEQQVVETKTVDGGKQVIEIQSAQPDVVYVPSYDPVVVYGPPAYPYYPYTYPGYYPGMGLAWGAAGFALGAWANGNWGNCDWNNGNININNNNNFNRNNNINGGNRNNINRPSQQPGRGQGGQGNKWQHRPEHRGNAPYGDRKTADKFGGRTQGQRPGGANRPGGGQGGINGNRPGGGAGNRPGNGPGASRPGSGSGTRPGSGSGTRPGSGSGARPGSGAKPSTRPSTRPSGGGDRVGNRSVSSGRSPGGNSALSGSRGGGYSGGSARASSSRGGRSMGGGGMSRGGGGGGRGGGGRR